ncbi:uncharacterized protein PV07_12554 [Cladophialophora immunda]|uniref:Uncharacterized protein n=1 Tax=Cladophialophora immunda TaxID=569365 RepID=A0A0D2CEU4_9EURO|nr:uncharacterized protein PV07_12554 [Cladophialophora immunda]KIW22049.1 hypothetical protein PV07_12554 [Cladophialophora immunda]
MDIGFSDNPWRSLDRVAFCENAILLEVKSQSQGKAHITRSKDIVMARPWRDEQSLRNFLNDAALVAAGPGGKDNVVATCLEWETTHKLCLRVARNEGFDEKACNQLQHHESLEGLIRPSQ